MHRCHVEHGKPEWFCLTSFSASFTVWYPHVLISKSCLIHVEHWTPIYGHLWIIHHWCWIYSHPLTLLKIPSNKKCYRKLPASCHSFHIHWCPWCFFNILPWTTTHRIGLWENWNRKALYYLMVKTHGFPVKIFPNKPIQWTTQSTNQSADIHIIVLGDADCSGRWCMAPPRCQTSDFKQLGKWKHFETSWTLVISIVIAIVIAIEPIVISVVISIVISSDIEWSSVALHHSPNPLSLAQKSLLRMLSSPMRRANPRAVSSSGSKAKSKRENDQLPLVKHGVSGCQFFPI